MVTFTLKFMNFLMLSSIFFTSLIFYPHNFHMFEKFRIFLIIIHHIPSLLPEIAHLKCEPKIGSSFIFPLPSCIYPHFFALDLSTNISSSSKGLYLEPPEIFTLGYYTHFKKAIVIQRFHLPS